jgi:hypothetical protein
VSSFFAANFDPSIVLTLFLLPVLYEWLVGRPSRAVNR